MLDNKSKGLLVRAEPSELAERICRRLIEEVRLVDGTIWLDADPAWSAAVNTVLIMKGVKVSELARLGSQT